MDTNPTIAPLGGGTLDLSDGVRTSLNMALELADSATDADATALAMKALAAAKRAVAKDMNDTVAPYKQATTAISGWYKAVICTIDAAIERCKKELAAVEKARRDAERERQAAEQAAHAAEDTARPTAPILPRAAAETAGPAVSTYEHHELVIDDPTAIPRAFLVPDTAAIKRALLAGTAVPGCRLNTELRVRAL